MTPTGENDEARDKMLDLIERTDGRTLLESLRDVYSDRLHRKSNDFEATLGLRLVIAKLQRTSYGPPVVTRSS